MNAIKFPRRSGKLAVALGIPALLCAAPMGYPHVGGLTYLAAFDHQVASREAMPPLAEVEFTVTRATIYNRYGRNPVGAAIFLSAKNKARTPRCVSASFNGGPDGQVENAGAAFLIGRGQTLRYFASSNTIYSACTDYDRICTVGMGNLTYNAWTPDANGKC